MFANSLNQYSEAPIAPLSPPVKLSTLIHHGKRIHVAREDLLPGGTKQRAIAQFAKYMAKRGFDHFLYASPFCGYAQIALAYVCQRLNLKCTIVAEQDPHFPNEPRLHKYSKIAQQYGARIVLTKTLQEAESKANALAIADQRSYKAPLGFDCPEYKQFLELELFQQWQIILQTLPKAPPTLWLPVGSGTLAQVFSQFVDKETRLHCVNVHVLSLQDPRIQKIRQNLNMTLFSSPQVFTEPAEEKPQIPSNEFYDAKLWKFISRHAESGDVWWNVGA